MKIKSDFITNSSSASFMILKENLSYLQMALIFDHIEVGMILANKYKYDVYPDQWKISETETEIKGHTSMDNFDMWWYLEKIGVRREHVEYDSSNDW